MRLLFVYACIEFTVRVRMHCIRCSCTHALRSLFVICIFCVITVRVWHALRTLFVYACIEFTVHIRMYWVHCTCFAYIVFIVHVSHVFSSLCGCPLYWVHCSCFRCIEFTVHVSHESEFAIRALHVLSYASTMFACMWCMYWVIAGQFLIVLVRFFIPYSFSSLSISHV